MPCRVLRAAQQQRREILRYRAREAGKRSAEKLRAELADAVKHIGGWSPPGSKRTDLAADIYRGDRVVVAFLDARRHIAAMNLE